MGYKENVCLVVSHIEGCSGNFLGYIASNQQPKNYFRVDSGEILNNKVLSINGRKNFIKIVDRYLSNQKIIVTHNYDINLIQTTFPNAQVIQIYPYTHIGNVLYNISHKKLNIILKNKIDNHYIHINEWYNFIQKLRPNIKCTNYWDLKTKNCIEKLLNLSLNEKQHDIFDNYWKNQLQYELDFPVKSMGILELINFWKIENNFTPWFISLVIFVFEKINSYSEKNRRWDINDPSLFKSWKSLCHIEKYY